MTPEMFLINQLAPAAGVPVSGDVPKDRPEEFVTVERTGGPQDRFLDHGTYAVQAWAPSRAQAARLIDKINRLIENLAAHPRVVTARVESTYNYPDPDVSGGRYQSTVTLTAHR